MKTFYQNQAASLQLGHKCLHTFLLHTNQHMLGYFRCCPLHTVQSFYKLIGKRGIDINIISNMLTLYSCPMYCLLYKALSAVSGKQLNITSIHFTRATWKKCQKCTDQLSPTKSCSPAINDVVQQSSSCSLLSSPFLQASIVFKGLLAALTDENGHNELALSVTRREAQAEERLITDRQLLGHPAVAWTENVRYFEDGGRC